MKHRSTLFVVLTLLFASLVFAACDSTAPEPAATAIPTSNQLQTDTTTPAAQPTQEAAAPSTNTPGPAPAAPRNVTDAAVVTQPPTPLEDQPSPTAVTETSSGADVTALQALAALKQKATAWQADARLAMLANTRPGQEKNLLGNALGDPNINEPTPGGKGRNWTLIAVSPSTGGAVAISMDGTQVDLGQQGAIASEVLARFVGPQMSALDLATMDTTKMADSDKISATAGARGQAPQAGIALLSPDGLGLGPLPTPPTGGAPAELAYELFSGDSTQQGFIFFDAITGAVVLDSAAP